MKKILTSFPFILLLWIALFLLRNVHGWVGIVASMLFGIQCGWMIAMTAIYYSEKGREQRQRITIRRYTINLKD